MDKRPTINDVARLSGVSKRTVSRVINGTGSVGPKTLTKVQEVIAELGFSPDKQARGLAASRSYLLGLVYDNPNSLYIDQVQRGVVSVSSDKGYELVVHPCNYNTPEFVENCLNFVKRSNIDGLILLPPVSESKPLADALKLNEIHYVSMTCVKLDDPEHMVVSDDRAAVGELARYLVSLGLSDIAVISGPNDYYSSVERLEGFRDTLAHLGITLPDNRVVLGNNYYESGLRCGRALLSQDNPPEVIFANNDEMAAGVLKVAYELGIRIPEDLCVAGFDDDLWASRVIPPLTTLRRPVTAMAKLAAKKLLGMIENNPGFEAKEFLVKPSLIVRSSTRKST
ncbi:LacI family DNA-binding transcriptional regulator [Alteromonas sp. C1M14]|uniref:LacI family DNA-binding transcriptional regulator n=1 Tax=Alteromonas sp. C1M14 TaxID=2841567 RepID=UPI001C09EC79|nr:LacI family DNA-binding transcriptional regulator [Alteromonas sp. C1M14]MBU2979949.1 LacI family DNA-binding transcriptional regulator [Alteromonas sp. C1M14]